MCRTTKGERSRTLFKSIALDEQRLSDRFSAVFLPTPSAQASEQKDAEGSPTRYANKLYLEIVFGVRILFDCANKIESDRSIRSVELSLYDRVCHLYASNTHNKNSISPSLPPSGLAIGIPSDPRFDRLLALFIPTCSNAQV